MLLNGHLDKKKYNKPADGPIWQEEPASHRLKSAASSYLDLREKTLARKRGSCKSLDTETTPATLHCQAAAGVSQEAGNTACTPAGLQGSCVHTYLAGEEIVCQARHTGHRKGSRIKMYPLPNEKFLFLWGETAGRGAGTVRNHAGDMRLKEGGASARL